jgi:hypothetical protein
MGDEAAMIWAASRSRKENCRCPDSLIGGNPGVSGLYCIYSHATRIFGKRHPVSHINYF